MRAIILCAGSGTRLRPHTDTAPKCMVPLAGRPLLSYQLESLRAVGIEDIVLVTGYCREAIGGELRQVVNADYATTNMLWSLFCAESEMDQDLIVAYGDIIYHPAIVQALLDGPHSLATTIDLEWRKLWDLRMQDPLTDAESLVMQPDGRLVEIGKKTPSYDRIQGQYMGLIRMDAAVLPAVRAHYHGLDPTRQFDGRSFRQMFMTSFLQSLIDAGQPMYAAPVRGGWLEVDTVEDLTRYEAVGLEQLGVIGTG